jgi:hypothetical protein
MTHIGIQVEITFTYLTDGTEPCSAMDKAKNVVEQEAACEGYKSLRFGNMKLINTEVVPLLKKESKAEAKLTYICRTADLRIEREWW